MSEAQRRREVLEKPLRRALLDAADNVRAIARLETAVAPLAPLLACYSQGHPDRPRWLLWRFDDRPWRCLRCHTWWVTRQVGPYEGYGWEWFPVTFPSTEDA